MEVPFFDPASVPFPEGIEKITRKIDPSPLAQLNQEHRMESDHLKNTFSVNTPTNPPQPPPLAGGSPDFFSTMQYPQNPPPTPTASSAYGFDVSPDPQPAPFSAFHQVNMQPVPDTPTMASSLPHSTFREVNSQATGTTATKFVSRHELTEKIKIITTLQEYKERGTSVQNLTINDSIDDLTIELERVRRFVQIHGTVDSYKTGLILFVNVVELVNKFSRRHFHLDDWGEHFINYDLQKSENYIFMMVEENKRVFSPVTMLIGTILGSAAFYHFTNTITKKVGNKLGDVFGNELASTLIKYFTKNPDALSNIVSGVGFGGGGGGGGNNNKNGGKYPPGENPNERKKRAEEEQNKKYANMFSTTGRAPPPTAPSPQPAPPTQPAPPLSPIRAVPIVTPPTPPPVQRPVNPTPVVVAPTVDFFVPPSIQVAKRERDVTMSNGVLPVPTFTQVLADDLQDMVAGPSTLPNGVSIFTMTATTTTTPPTANSETFQNISMRNWGEAAAGPSTATIQEIPDDEGSMTNFTEISVGGTSHKRKRRRMKNVLVI
jgi:hypothetical protein